MDVKIANFDRAFTQMQSRLVRNRGTLEKLKARMENEALNSPELDREIIEAVRRIEGLIGQKLQRNDFNDLRQKIEHMEEYIKGEIAEKRSELDDMHNLLEHFTTLGSSIQKAKKAHQDGPRS